MRTSPIEPGRSETATRPRARSFGPQLDKARRAVAGLRAGRASREGAAAAPADVRVRRRREADSLDRGLNGRREDLAAAADAAAERRTNAVGPEPRAEMPPPASLAAAVGRLQLALESRERAAGPSVEMQFGSSLRIRLTRGAGGLELELAARPAVARLARSELPGLLARLRAGGIAVARAAVSEARLGVAGAGAQDAGARIDGGAGPR